MPVPHPTRCCALMVGIAALAGCQLIPRSSPVTQELAEARRLSHEGLAAADRDNLERAEELLGKAVESCPTDIDARQHYAEVLWQRGEQLAAISQIKQALQVAPDDEGLCVAGGMMYLELGLLDDADKLAQSAVSTAPKSARCWYLHAQTNLARGRIDDALGDFHRALAIEPDNREVLLDTAEAYRRADRPTRALATLAILEETYGPGQIPGSVHALEGMAQEALGRPADALASYRLAQERGDLSETTGARIAALTASAAGPLASAPENGATLQR
jgi:tetratricopeptide (TPR) repeat protein